MIMTSFFVCVILNLGRKKSTGMEPYLLYCLLNHKEFSAAVPLYDCNIQITRDP